MILFAVVYALVFWFVRRHAKKIEKTPTASLSFKEDEQIRESRTGMDKIEEKTQRIMKRAAVWFGVSMGIAILFILVTSRIPSISDLAFPVMALLFFFGGLGGGILAKQPAKEIVRTFGKGVLNMLPGILLLAMAYSVKLIIDNGGITDTILYRASNWIADKPKIFAAFMIYLITLAMNFFIGSASAKSFLMMPILAPLADLVGVTRQTAVLAFEFGDGFSNMIYPSNAILLIALGFTVVGYPKWARWTLPLQGILLAVTVLFLLGAVIIEYGPH